MAWPFFATLGILAEPVIRILFGEKWLESVPVLRILCIHAILVYTTLLVDQMLISSGRIRTSFRIMASIQIATVIAVLFTARYGLIWVAAAVAAVGVVQLCTYQMRWPKTPANSACLLYPYLPQEYPADGCDGGAVSCGRHDLG